MFQAHNVLFKSAAPNVKDVYGSNSLLWLAGPLCSWCCGRAEASCPPSSSDDALPDHSTQASAPQVFSLVTQRSFQSHGGIQYPAKTGFWLGRGHLTTCGLLETFCPMCVWSTQLCSTPIPEHFNGLWCLLLPLQAHTLTPEIHTRPLSYTVHKNTSHISQ